MHHTYQFNSTDQDNNCDFILFFPALISGYTTAEQHVTAPKHKSKKKDLCVIMCAVQL